MAAPLVTALVSFLPQIIDGAKEIFSSKEAFKENLKEGTTKAATLPVVVASGVTAATGPTLEALVFDFVMALTALGLFLYKKNGSGTK